MRAIYRAVEDDKHLLVSINVNAKVFFALYSYEEERLKFKSVQPYMFCNEWAYEKSSDKIATLGSEDVLSTFSALDGSLLASNKMNVPEASSLLIRNKIIRILHEGIAQFNDQGQLISNKYFRGYGRFDLLTCIVSQSDEDGKYHIYNGSGELLFSIEKQGLGVMCADLYDGQLAISESKGKIRIFSLPYRRQIAQINPPNEYHATSIAFDSRGLLHARHIRPGIPGITILTTYDLNGLLLNVERTEDKTPSAMIFSQYFGGWLLRNFDVYYIQDGLKKKRLEKLYTELEFFCTGWGD